MSTSSRHHWVIGDVHGCHDSLQELLSVLPGSDHLVFCGDVINRGPQIEATMNLVWGLVCAGRATWLRGNHEQALIDALSGENASCQDALGQLDTVHQLGEARCRQWLTRLTQLPMLYRAPDWCATHAGFTAAGEPDLSIRDAFWDSYDGSLGRAVVGHTPRPQLERREWIVLVDTGAVYGGPLSAFCPETDAVVQVHGADAAAALNFPDVPDRVPAQLAGHGLPC